jgi:hypothetical protein
LVPYTSIWTADVRTILARAKLTTAEAAAELGYIYEQAVLHLAADCDLSAAGLELLASLRNAFELSEGIANGARAPARTF